MVVRLVECAMALEVMGVEDRILLTRGKSMDPNSKKYSCAVPHN